ncbi:hypothetical protein C9374_004396 [Naegleria lovaniensis]|uniref:G-protein alpha subunit n=1 Tax=Naegleria lovaniensis TaxID=51637 RepID=A0AA88GJA6_NAELO|nr:uncharacterized protein C9374_008535 [Naegleria lovaniensis]XP_044548738.1 uncharacterized protein C9374_004396 [Naegleria lovaniensis]KAG2378392.1 hypothetical protein C9374_008535 [Naegleria lovaniensis]KAG2383059.1 hypothetical protein C9374_004396 [Naegleria lovaniensis]
MKKSSSPLLNFQFITGVIPSGWKGTKSLILLGTGEGGKTTFQRQIYHLKNQELNTKERHKYAETIQYSIFNNLKTITEHPSVVLNSELKKLASELASLVDQYVDSRFDHSHREKLVNQGPIFQKLVDHHHVREVIESCELYPQLHLTGDYKYFFKHYTRIACKEYQPTFEDFKRMQLKTVGVIKGEEVEFENYKITITDTGGQRNERKKWAKALSQRTDAILFMVSMREAFQMCYEDHELNRSKETIDCFQELLSLEYVNNCPIFVVFTKTDLLEEVLKKRKVSFNSTFPEYKGDNYSIEEIKSFMKEKYQSLDSNKQIKGFFFINTLISKEVSDTLQKVLEQI